MSDRISFARGLRREQTPAERRFWRIVQPWRAQGWHFRRQSPVGPYVADFRCTRAGLIVEIDGDDHYFADGRARDLVRTAYLERRGYRVLRFSNLEVMENAEGVFEVMRKVLGEPGG
ncbi:endonuclease domain-containing protein [Arsenicitalea aurantiaca]|uniref:Endonuclease domain-containing protein n=2 Tax=Arsenicitalea aurantiaca TaxID=1783274 RepID=A0A433X851_9HYPH|nr:endonuclease domain-containing protein [Arsenicitalea aurantiaca]RUT30267.1 endonuclease domain-containing protein [Arsenicitalea aurantiaca]